MQMTNGEVFAGFKILRLLGSGGMGEVYLAQHPRLPRRNALKVLRADVSADSDYRARFEREADLASTLFHSHIVGVHDRGEVDGRLWITMDYVDGTDAACLMRDRYPYGMPVEDVLDIVSAIADALDYAHERRLLHRDVKPANILIADSRAGERRVLLADFGIARAVNDPNGLTATNVTVGSVAYAAPEQLRGAPLDGRADQYALACSAFHMLTGAPPFVNSNPVVVIGDKLSSPPPRLTTVRPDLAAIDDVLARAMAKEPVHRFPTCRAFAAALSEAATSVSRSTDETQFAAASAEAPRQARQPNGIDLATVFTRRRAAFIAAGVVALVVTVGVVAFIGARLGRPQPPPATSSPSPTVPASLPPQPQSTSINTAPPGTTGQPSQPPTPLQPSIQPPTPPQPPTAPRQPPPSGDLGLAQPISRPACNGQGIVILGSVTTPGLYAAGVQQLLNAHPGAF